MREFGLFSESKIGAMALTLVCLTSTVSPLAAFGKQSIVEPLELKTASHDLNVMRKLREIRMKLAQLSRDQIGVRSDKTKAVKSGESSESMTEVQSPTGKSTTIQGRFPGADVPAEPKDMLERVGGMPLDVPQELDLGVDPREQAILKRQRLLNRFNPAIGFVIEPIAGYSKRRQRFNSGDGRDAGRPVGTFFPSNVSAALRTVEIFASAEVDPFARAYIIASGHSESVNNKGSEDFSKSQFEIEEAAIQTTSLPFNFSVRGGRFFADWGYLGRRHLHDLPQIDEPPSLNQLYSRNQLDGIEVTWLAPTPIFLQFTAGYGAFFGQLSEEPLASFQQQVIQGNTVFGSIRSYYDITDDHNIELGFSGVYSPQGQVPEAQDRALLGVTSDESISRYTLDLDFHYRWYPLGRGLRQSFSVHGEVLYDWGQGRRDQRGSITSRGAWAGYAYGEYRISKRWRPGFRFDYYQLPSEPALVFNQFSQAFGSTANSSGSRTDVKTYSPYITFYPSEFQRFILQYNHQSYGNASNQDQVLLQWEAVIGSHQHGFTERD